MSALLESSTSSIVISTVSATSVLSLSSRTSQTPKRGSGGRGIPRCAGLYGIQALEQAQHYESLQEEQFQEMRKRSQTEHEKRKGLRLPTL
jgi:hypothetical protein